MKRFCFLFIVWVTLDTFVKGWLVYYGIDTFYSPFFWFPLALIYAWSSYMKSEARKRLCLLFGLVPIGSKFHMVNSVMGGAVPGTPTFKKIENLFDTQGNVICNAVRLNDHTQQRIRESAEVELLE